MDTRELVVGSIFDREIERAEQDQEPSDFIAWLTALRDEVLAALPYRDWNPSPLLDPDR